VEEAGSEATIIENLLVPVGFLDPLPMAGQVWSSFLKALIPVLDMTLRSRPRTEIAEIPIKNKFVLFLSLIIETLALGLLENRTK
jgi:hypothetical protein